MINTSLLVSSAYSSHTKVHSTTSPCRFISLTVGAKCRNLDHFHHSVPTSLCPSSRRAILVFTFCLTQTLRSRFNDRGSHRTQRKEDRQTSSLVLRSGHRLAKALVWIHSSFYSIPTRSMCELQNLGAEGVQGLVDPEHWNCPHGPHYRHHSLNPLFSV